MKFSFKGSTFYLILLTIICAQFAIAQDVDREKSLNNQWDAAASKAEADFTTIEKHQSKNWNDYKKRVLQKWADGEIPERKTYVKYFDDDNTRIKVDYENGTVSAESLTENIGGDSATAKKAISDALKSIISVDAKEVSPIIAKDEIASGSATTDDLVTKLIQDVKFEGASKAADGKERQRYRLTFKLVPNYIKLRAAKFRPIVEIWAKKYKLKPEFVLAIIRQESSFNPRARSWVPAYGLMQIVPKYAGREVMKAVTGKSIDPDSEFLFDPEKNIMMGTTYLKILRDQYFPDIKDEDKQAYVITASYNWGPHRIKIAITKGRVSVREPSSVVFTTIQKIAPAETSEYLRKVTAYTAEFKGKD